MKRVLNNIDEISCDYCFKPIKAGAIMWIKADEYGVSTRWHGEHGRDPKPLGRFKRLVRWFGL